MKSEANEIVEIIFGKISFQGELFCYTVISSNCVKSLQ